MNEITFSKKDVKLVVPRLPNFIKVNGSYQPLCSFSHEELRIIGKAWTDSLIAASERQKKNLGVEL